MRKLAHGASRSAGPAPASKSKRDRPISIRFPSPHASLGGGDRFPWWAQALVIAGLYLVSKDKIDDFIRKQRLKNFPQSVSEMNSIFPDLPFDVDKIEGSRPPERYLRKLIEAVPVVAAQLNQLDARLTPLEQWCEKFQVPIEAASVVSWVESNHSDLKSFWDVTGYAYGRFSVHDVAYQEVIKTWPELTNYPWKTEAWANHAIGIAYISLGYEFAIRNNAPVSHAWWVACEHHNANSSALSLIKWLNDPDGDWPSGILHG